MRTKRKSDPDRQSAIVLLVVMIVLTVAAIYFALPFDDSFQPVG